MAFVELIYNLLRSNMGNYENEEKNHIIETLLKYDGLLTSIVQWGYWDAEHRPDIIDELVNDECETIVGLGRDVSTCLVADAIQNKGNSNILSNEFKSRIQAVGMTPIVSKLYDPNCMISFTAGLVHQGKAGTEASIAFTILRFLVTEADCVDKDIISEVIDIGLKYTDDYKSALNVAITSYSMILEDSRMDKGYPSDTRTAFAVRSGLIEMCLNFIVRYESQISLSDGCASMFSKTIATMILAVHSISLHQKTAKAIRSKKAVIEERLIELEQNPNISDVRCMKLLGMVRSILALNGSYCCRCNKSLSRTEVQLCNGCGCMAYCSRACQKEDWLNGHSLTCNKPPIDKQLGLFQGRAWLETVPDCPQTVAKLEELETNLAMIQLKLFLDNSEAILSQAGKLDLPLCDCVVAFNCCRQCPHTITVKKYTEYYGEELDDFECSRSRENIMCVYYARFYNGESEEDKGQDPNLAVQRLFPHAWLILKQSKE